MENQSADSLPTPGTPKKIVLHPGDPFPLEIEVNPDERRLCRNLIELKFATTPPEPPPLPPLPEPPPPNNAQVITLGGGMSPQEMYQREVESYRMQYGSADQRWREAHPMRYFSIQAEVKPGKHEGEKLVRGVVPTPTSQPGGPSVLYAGNYHMLPPDLYATDDPYSQQSQPSVVTTLSVGANDSLSHTIFTLEKDYHPAPPPPPEVETITEIEFGDHPGKEDDTSTPKRPEQK